MSGRKSNLRQFQSITAGDMSQASLTSAVTNIQMLDNLGIQLNFSGTPTGDFAIQVSMDYAQDTNGNVLNAGNWVPITLTPAPSAIGVAGQIYINITELSAPWIRQTFTSTLIGSAAITTIEDISGNLNSTYWLLDGANGDNWYVWYNGGSGLDPAITGRTGIEVTFSQNDTADAIATATRSALASCTSIDTIGGSADQVTFAQTQVGSGSLADGANPTGFALAYTGSTGTLNAFISGKML